MKVELKEVNFDVFVKVRVGAINHQGVLIYLYICQEYLLPETQIWHEEDRNKRGIGLTKWRTMILE